MPEHLLSDLLGQSIEISAHCECTKVTVFAPETLIAKLGDGATLEIATERLRCRVCRNRPRLFLERTWATTGARDGRVDPPRLPDWVRLLLR